MKISLLVKLISFFYLLLNMCSIPCYSYNIPRDDITTLEDENNLIEDNKDLKSQFKPLLDNLFLNRNSSILSNDSEGLKSFWQDPQGSRVRQGREARRSPRSRR